MLRIEPESVVQLIKRGLMLALLIIQYPRFFIILVRQLPVVRLRALGRRLTLLPAIVLPRSYSWRGPNDGDRFRRRRQNRRVGRRRGWKPCDGRRRRRKPRTSRRR